MLARKGLFIVLLISLIGAYFYLRPFLYQVKIEANVSDRLPVGDFLGKIHLLNLARESNSFLYYNKVPFRDFLTPEFILAQSKNHGINIQKPIYFFVNETREWGAIVHVNDSSKILSGITRLRQNIEVQDTIIGGTKVYQIANQNIYFNYGKNYLFIYSGTQLTKRLYHVIYSKKGEIHQIWKEFLRTTFHRNESLIVYSKWTKFSRYGIQKAIFTHHADSMNLNLKAYFKSSDEFEFKLKEKGLGLKRDEQNVRSVSLHFDTEKIKSNPNSPLKLLLSDLSKRINLPIEDFFNAWEGDITFQEGKNQLVKETYIETEFDDEFNMTEIRKQKDVQVPGYEILLSMNRNQKDFVTKLFAKGIMRQENKRFYILTSPPLKIIQHKSYLMLYSSQFAPKIVESKSNGGFWKYKNTNYEFKIDSLNRKEFFFSLNFRAMNLIWKNKLLN